MSRTPRHPDAARSPRTRSAFTLVELLIASIIAVFVAGATTMAIAQMIRSRDSSVSRFEAFSRAESAASVIASDAIGTLRDEDPFFVRVIISDGHAAGAADADTLLLFTRSLRRVRPMVKGGGTPEGDEYEVQYRLERPAQPSLTALPTRGTPAPPQSTLWRRADPAPDEDYDAGGVAAPVIEGVVALSVLAFDGEEWRNEWDSDYDGLPHAIRITVTASDSTQVRSATARRTVALDRTPLPGSAEPSSTDDTSSGTTGSTSP